MRATYKLRSSFSRKQTKNGQPMNFRIYWFSFARLPSPSSYNLIARLIAVTRFPRLITFHKSQRTGRAGRDAFGGGGPQAVSSVKRAAGTGNYVNDFHF